MGAGASSFISRHVVSGREMNAYYNIDHDELAEYRRLESRAAQREGVALGMNAEYVEHQRRGLSRRTAAAAAQTTLGAKVFDARQAALDEARTKRERARRQNPWEVRYDAEGREVAHPGLVERPPPPGPRICVVEVVAARGIIAADYGGTSDPYVTVTLGDEKHKTKVKKKTLSPQWNQRFTFLTSSALRGLKLDLEMFDWDAGSNDDFIGGVQIPLERADELALESAPARWLTLKPKQPDAPQVSGYLTLRTFFGTKDKRKVMHVHVTSATGVLATDANGFSDPYVVVRLVRRGTSDDHERKVDVQRTRVVSKSLNPVFDEVFAFKDVQRESDSFVMFEVFDHDLLSANDPLGMATVQCRDMQEGDLKAGDRCTKPYNLTLREHTDMRAVAGELNFMCHFTDETCRTLFVQVTKAREIKAADPGGTSDGFVKVSVKGQTKRTATMKRTLSPVWRQSFEFDLTKEPDSSNFSGALASGAAHLAGAAAERLRRACMSRKELAAYRKKKARGEGPSTDDKRVTKLFDEEREERLRQAGDPEQYMGDEVVFDLYDEDDFSADDFLGRVRFPLHLALTHEDGPGRSFWLPFQTKSADRVKGELLVRFTFPTKESIPQERVPPVLHAALHDMDEKVAERHRLQNERSRHDLENNLSAILFRQLRQRGLNSEVAAEQAKLGVGAWQWPTRASVKAEEEEKMRAEEARAAAEAEAKARRRSRRSSSIAPDAIKAARAAAAAAKATAAARAKAQKAGGR